MTRNVLFVALVIASLCTFASATGTKNIIDAPDQCPEGQKVDANGICQEVWGRSEILQAGDPRNIIVVPPSCPPCYKADSTGRCKAIFGCEKNVPV